MRKESFIRAVRKSGTSLAVSIPPEIISLLEIKESNLLRVKIEKIKKK